MSVTGHGKRVEEGERKNAAAGRVRVWGAGWGADHKENRPIRERTAGLGRGQMIKASQVMAESGFHLFRWQRGTH